MKRLALIFLVACHHDAPKPPPGDPPCVKVAHHLVDIMAAGDPSTDAAKAINEMIRERCEKDLWSVDAQNCLIAMKTIEDQAKCEEFLTIPQRDALVKGIDEKFPRDHQ